MVVCDAISELDAQRWCAGLEAADVGYDIDEGSEELEGAAGDDAIGSGRASCLLVVVMGLVRQDCAGGTG